MHCLNFRIRDSKQFIPRSYQLQPSDKCNLMSECTSLSNCKYWRDQRSLCSSFFGLNLSLNVVHGSSRLLNGVLFSALLPPNHIKPYRKYHHDHNNDNQYPEETSSRSRRALQRAIVGGWFNSTNDDRGCIDAFVLIFKHKPFSARAHKTSKSVITLLTAFIHRTFINVQTKHIIPNKAFRTEAYIVCVSVTYRGAFLLCTVHFALPGVLAVWDVSFETRAFITSFYICAYMLTRTSWTALRALENFWIW